MSSRSSAKTVDYSKMMEGGASTSSSQSESSAAEGEGERGGASKPVDNTGDQTVPS